MGQASPPGLARRAMRRNWAARVASWLTACALLLIALPARGWADGEAIGEEGVRAARQVLPGVVRIQWRGRGERPVVIERHAVAVDADGWLLLAGPPPPADGTLAATFHDGRSMSARVWATDPRTALTLLRLPLSDLPTVEIRADGASDRALVPERLPAGTRVMMVSAEGSLARGVLRGSHRTRILGPGDAVTSEVTCLDEAALHVVPTDLGAPWIDERGRVVGLLVGADVSVPRLEGKDAEGLRPRPEVVAAYAIPASVLRTVWPLLRDRRRVPRGTLGVWTAPLSDLLQRHVCRDCGGRVVTDVEERGAAAHAGILPNDIIRKVAGRALAPQATLGDVLLDYRPGDRVTLGLLRAGEEITVEAVLEGGE